MTYGAGSGSGSESGSGKKYPEPELPALSKRWGRAESVFKKDPTRTGQIV